MASKILERMAIARAFVLCLLALAPGCAPEDGAAEPLGVTRQAYTCDPSLEPDPNVTYLYVAPDGSNSSSQNGSCSEPWRNLREAASRLRDWEGITLSGGFPTGLSEHSYTIYVRGGTYYETSERSVGTAWKVGPEAGESIRILAYPGERPIFDGAGLVSDAFQYEIGQGVLTDFQVSGLTFRHYRNGLKITGDTESDWTGGVTISDNVFEEIGDVYDQGNCAWHLQQNPTANCFGASMVGLQYARHNTIERNVFLRGESLDGSETFKGGSRMVMHAVYISRRSHDNTIRDNYVRLISGDPIRFRDGASCNKIQRNYITDSGQKAAVSCWKTGSETNCGTVSQIDDPDNPGQTKPCGANEIEDNVITFGYPWTDLDNTDRCADPLLFINSAYGGGSGIDDQGNNLFDGDRPKSERIRGVAKGDLDGDGKQEVIVALSYGDTVPIRFSKIVSSDGELPYLSRVLYADEPSGRWVISDLVTGRFDANGRDQLVSSWNRINPLPYRAEVWRGDGTPLTQGADGTRNLGRTSGRDDRVVDALAAGDFDNSGVDQLLVARRTPLDDTTRIYYGDATSLGTTIYSSTSWRVQAMAGGDWHAYGVDWLYAAYYKASSDLLRIYEGRSDPNGNWTLKDVKLYESTDKVNSLAVTYGRGLYAAIDRDSGSDRILYSTRPGSFSLVIDPGPGILLSDIAEPSGINASPLYVEESPEFNAIYEDDESFHRWDEPPATNVCTGP